MHRGKARQGFILRDNRGKIIRLSKTILTVSLCLLPLYGCGVAVETLDCNLDELRHREPISPKSITSLVHVDGSGSMLGYVSPKVANSKYSQTIELLYNTFSLSPGQRGMPESQFFRSNSATDPITPSQFRQAKNADFYDGTNPSFQAVTSDLDRSIVRNNLKDQKEDRENSDKLLVLVTDLNMNEGDNTRLIKKIQENYFSQSYPGNAVAVIGIMSEFAGTVYPVDGSSPFQYPESGSGSGLRPFYVLMMGPLHEIEFYVEALKKNGDNIFDDSNISIFNSAQVVKEIVHLGKPINFTEDQISQPGSLNDGKAALEESDPELTELFEISSSAKKQNIQYKIPLTETPYSTAINFNTLKFNYFIEHFDKIEKKFVDQSSDAQIQKAISITNISINTKKDSNEKEITFEVAIDPDPIAGKSGIYKFTIDAFVQDFADSEWWTQWNLNPGDDNSGAKTLGLLNFLQSTNNIASSQAKSTNPPFGRFCLGIQKN